MRGGIATFLRYLPSPCKDEQMRDRVVRVLSLVVLFGASLLAACQPMPPWASTAARPAALESLAVDPADGSLLTADGGLFRSGDHGQHWRPLPVPSALHPDRLRQVTTSTATPTSLFAAGPGAGIVRSDDDGRHWRSISAGLPSQDVGAFAVHSFRPETIYAAIAGQGVFRTEDGGSRWQKMDEGPPAPVVALTHSTLEGSMNTGWLYAATPDGPYLSMDCF